MKTPVLFLIFNRPNVTQKIFDVIKKIKPRNLYIAADGPRPNVKSEKELCEQTRSIIKDIDWDCNLNTLFREENLGCKDAVSQAIDWFFENVEEGIILEDDCLPSLSFFTYCEELLEKYRYDTRVMHISGESPLREQIGTADYYFSPIPHIWGWATWKRAWNLYDVNIDSLSNFIKERRIKDIFKEQQYQEYWLKRFSMTKEGEINTWDYQWTYTLFINNGLAINSNHNLISNIGAGEDATHTSYESNVFNKSIYEINQITHPTFIQNNKIVLKQILEERFNIYLPKTLKLHEKIYREIKRPLTKAGICNS